VGQVKLYMNDASPFARKVRVAAAERGLDRGIELVRLNPHERGAELVAANPLSKVPTLVAADGTAHVDSLAICIYLDTLGTGLRLVPLDGRDGFAALQRHALADGATDAAVLRRVESQKSAVPDRLEWMERQRHTIGRVLDRFEATVAGFGATMAIDTVALACLLAYLDFRFPADGWRGGRPELARWYEQFAARPSFLATRFPE
jgi:glutathione S-transferase